MYSKNVNSDTTDLLENLIPKDREETIDNRSLKPEWVAANCLSVTAKQATELLGYPAKSSGIWLQGSGYQCQFRPHKPWRSNKDNENGVTKAPKYRTPQEYDGEYDAILPRHPDDINFWHRKETIAANCYKINEHPYLVITEGVFKALKLFGDGGIATISLLGVEMGLSSRKQDPEGRRYLVKSLKMYANLGFGFIIAFDADCATNPNVIRAQKRLARQLETYNVPVRSITGLWKVEDGKGLDDYIQKHGINKFIFDVLSKSIPHEEWEELQAQRTPNAPPQADEIYTQQALSALYGEGHWMAVGGILHKWTGTHYQALGTESERRRIAQWCFSHSVAKGDRWISSYATETHVNNIWGWVLVWFGVDGDQLNPPGINCLNGRLVITWDGSTPHWELKPHNPLDCYTYCAAFHYDPNADSTECDRLLDCLDAPQQKILLQTIAASLDLGHLRQYLDRVRCLILLGHGRNGKDAIRFATEIIYGEALSDASLGDFMRYDQGTKNALAKLAGARVNWPSENTRFSNIDNIQCLKAIITGNVFHVKLLFKEEAKAVSHAVYLFNVNESPNLEAGLEAIKSRYSIIKFNKTYVKGADPKKGELEADPRFTYSRDWVGKNVVPALINKLLAELSAIAVEGIDYSSTEKALEEVQQETNHLWAFAHESGLQYQVGGRVYIKDLWAKLQEWYLENGTLVINTDGGKEKREWYELANSRDKPCKKDNVLAPRFKELFPKIERKIETTDQSRVGQAYLVGLAFSASSASCDAKSSIPASLTDSLNEAANEAETLTHKSHEAHEADLTPLAVSEKTDLDPPPHPLPEIPKVAVEPQQVGDASPKVGEYWLYRTANMVRSAVVEIKAIRGNIYRWYHPDTHSFGDSERDLLHRKVVVEQAAELQQVGSESEAPCAGTIAVTLLPETTVEQAIEAAEAINVPPTNEGDSVRQQQAELNTFGSNLSIKYNELARVLAPEILKPTAPPTSKTEVGDRSQEQPQTKNRVIATSFDSPDFERILASADKETLEEALAHSPKNHKRKWKAIQVQLDKLGRVFTAEWEGYEACFQYDPSHRGLTGYVISPKGFKADLIRLPDWSESESQFLLLSWLKKTTKNP